MLLECSTNGMSEVLRQSVADRLVLDDAALASCLVSDVVQDSAWILVARRVLVRP